MLNLTADCYFCNIIYEEKEDGNKYRKEECCDDVKLSGENETNVTITPFVKEKSTDQLLFNVTVDSMIVTTAVHKS
jgi:hypothetical protein